MEFRILGPLEVFEGGHLVEIRPAKLRALLAILVLHANEVVSVEKLIDGLWGEVPPASAANTLQGYVSQLRNLLEPGRRGTPSRVVHTSARGYVLATEAESIDAWRFEHLATEGRRALAQSNADDATKIFGEALGLWRGSVLEEFAYEQFVQEATARLEELRLGVIEERIAAEFILGRHLETLGELKALTTAAPLRERPWGQLMLALYRGGRQADALQAYQNLRRTLAEELGIYPSPELQRLEAAILAQDPALRHLPSSPDALPGSGTTIECRSCVDVTRLPQLLSRPDVLPLVGRQAELDELTAAWDAAASCGTRRAVLVAGEPGIGKTRLAAEVARRAHAQDAIVLAGRCDEGMRVPYQPFVEALRHFVDSSRGCHLTDHLGRWPGELIRLVPEIDNRIPGLKPPLTADAETERYRLFDAVASWLGAASARRPVLLVLDDLHWATKSTVLLLRHLLRSSQAMRLLIVATYRDDEVDQSHPLNELLASVAREPDYSRLCLGGLDEADVKDLIAAAGGRRLGAASPSWTATIHADTKGNPFFVAEVVRHLLESSAIERGEPPDSLLDRGIPEGVRTVVARRLSRLSDATVAVLSTASVAGLEFELPIIEAASRLDEDVVVSALEEAISSRLVEDSTASSYRFSHGLVRATLYAQMAHPRRALVHRRVGEAIEARYGDAKLPELAYHVLRASVAGGDDRAIDVSVRAAERSFGLLAYEQAAEWYGSALDVLRTGHSDDPRAADLLIRRGEAQLAAGDIPASRDSFGQAAVIARRNRDADQLARAALGFGAGFGGFEVKLLDPVQVELLEEALSALDPGPSQLRAWVLARLSVALSFMDAPTRRRSLSEEAVAMARQDGDQSVLGYALAGHCDSIPGPDDSETRLRQATEVVGLADAAGDRSLELLGRRLRLVALLEVGDVGEADAEIERFAEVADQIRQPLYRWYVPLWRGMRALMRRDSDEAMSQCMMAREIGAQAQSDNADVLTFTQWWVRQRYEGRFAEAGQAMADLLEREMGAPVMEPAGWPYAAVVAVQLGDHRRARTLLEQSLQAGLERRTRDSEWLPESAQLAEAATLVGSGEVAELLYEQLRPYGDRFCVEGIGSAFVGSVAWYLGLLARFLGHRNEAESYQRRARAAHRRVGLVGDPPPLGASG